MSEVGAEAGRLFATHRERLVKFVHGRLDRRLRGRLDPSDVVQEACAEAVQRLPEYQRAPRMPFFVWLRFLVAQRLALAHRQHLGTHQRDVTREQALIGHDPQAHALAECLAASQASPSSAAARAELRERTQAAIAALAPADREILALRHFEQLTNAETAAVLELSLSAASHRYARALLRLQAVLGEVFGEGSP